MPVVTIRQKVHVNVKVTVSLNGVWMQSKSECRIIMASVIRSSVESLLLMASGDVGNIIIVYLFVCNESLDSISRR